MPRYFTNIGVMRTQDSRYLTKEIWLQPTEDFVVVPDGWRKVRYTALWTWRSAEAIPCGVTEGDRG